MLCKVCQKEFTVHLEDKAFYEKMSAPAPTKCPDCRQRLRMSFVNERRWFKRKCDLTGQSIIAMYPEDSPYLVYEGDAWWSDKWDAINYGRDYDFSQKFFEQFKTLQLAVPRLNLFVDRYSRDSNAVYTNYSSRNANSHFLVYSLGSRDCFYCDYTYNSNYCAECFDVEKNELCYRTVFTTQVYNSIYCLNGANMVNCYFCYDCSDMQNCAFCFGLENKEYYVSNQPVSKEEFEKLVETLKYTQKNIEAGFARFSVEKLKYHHRYAEIYKSENCTGDYLMNCKNVIDSFNIVPGEDHRYCLYITDCKDCYDCLARTIFCQLGLELVACNKGYNCKFCLNCMENITDCDYCDHCSNCKNCFGCVGLRHKENCIFNKEYSPAEYQKLKTKIIEQMKKNGEYGEFFPPELSPFAYNNTMANFYYPQKEATAKSLGWQWSKDKTDYQSQTYQVPEDIRQVKDDILKAVLADEKTGQNYAITKQELELYRKLGVPIPRRAPYGRYEIMMSLRNPRKLYHRTCMCEQSEHGHDTKCPVEFETTFAPDRPEIIYCAECYKKEKY